jgi:hypothetical protein
MNRNKLKLIFLLTILVQLFIAQAALAQTTQQTTGQVQTIADQYGNYPTSGPQKTIEDYLCTPYTGPVTTTSGSSISSSWTAAAPAGATNPAAGDLYSCINKIYKFAIILASVGAVLYIVIAGYMYMSAEGNTEMVDKAKSYVTSAITALAILFAGYLILRFLNPDLIQFQNIQPPSVTPTTVAPPSTTTVTSPATGGSTPQGACNNCVSLSSVSVPTLGGANISVTQTVAIKLQAMNQQPALAGISWSVSSGYDYRPTASDCHNTGACADLVVTPATNTNWSAVCLAASAAGFSTILNEASVGATGCPTFQTYATTDGANIHVAP